MSVVAKVVFKDGSYLIPIEFWRTIKEDELVLTDITLTKPAMRRLFRMLGKPMPRGKITLMVSQDYVPGYA
jgi:hypothetical protein